MLEQRKNENFEKFISQNHTHFSEEHVEMQR